MSAQQVKFLAYSCLHLPLHHEGFRQWRLEQISKHKPDVVVNLGDWHDSDYASRWADLNDDHNWDSEAEFALLAKDAGETRKAAGDAKIVWVLGNHDANPAMPGRVPKKVRASVEARKWDVIGPHVSDWKIVKYAHDSFYRIGQVTFQHGCQTNVNAERDQALLYGVPYGLHISGHTHRPQPVTRIVLPGKVPIFGMHYANVGTGADWDKMRYIQRSNHALWGRGLIVGECNSARSWFGSKQWSAELIIHSMASDR